MLRRVVSNSFGWEVEMRVPATHNFIAATALPLALTVAAVNARAADPLPSWNDGKAKQSILDFVAKVTREGSPQFVPPAERIAVFDNDGTLWAEQPLYFQILFAVDRVKALAPQHPQWKETEAFASLLKGDVKAALAQGEKALVEIVMAAHAGITTEEFDQVVNDWLATARHPRTGRPYTDMAYQPMVELLGNLPAGVTLNGIVAHEDWLPTFAAAAGAPDIREKLQAGVGLNGRQYRNYIDGYNQLDYLSGKTAEAPRKEFIYVNDDAQIVAMRMGDWKAVFLENRGQAFGVWREPFTDLRVPLLFNLRRDPFERAQHNSNTYNDWFLDRVYVIVPMQQIAAKFLMTMKEYPPSQSPGSFNLEKIEKMIRDAAGGQ